MNSQKNNCIYIIEPHPDDALGSAAGLIYSTEIQTVICTLSCTCDVRNLIDLEEAFRSRQDVLRRDNSIAGQYKYDLDDLHWDLRCEISLSYQETVDCYCRLYGGERLRRLKAVCMQVLKEVVEKNAQIAFPMGLLHPMHVLVSSVMIECILEMHFPVDQIWIYVDHPYDVYCIGSTRMLDCRKYIETRLGVLFTRYDFSEMDQAAAGEVLRLIYGDIHHAEFSDTFRKTFCSVYITENRKRQVPCLRLKRNRVLFLTDQTLPFYKKGGLGDVSYGFAFSAVNYADQIQIMLPVHEENDVESLPGEPLEVKTFHYSDSRSDHLTGRILVRAYQGIVFYLLDMPDLFCWDMEGRYAILADVIISRILPIIDYQPDILHCNDWQMGFVPFLLKTKYRSQAEYIRIKTLYTIHSYGYQGICNKQDILRLVGLDRENCRLCPACMPECQLDRINNLGSEQLKLIGKEDSITASFMKAGIFYSDQVSTVSSGYAEELESYPDLNGVSIVGIRNGIGPEVYSPSNHPDVKFHYSPDNAGEGKCRNKLWFQAEHGLEVSEDIPLFCMVCRLSHVKGIDSIINIITRLLELPLQLVIVGDDAEFQYSSVFDKIMRDSRRKFWYSLFHPALEFQVYAAADILLMPSHSESCGMTQILAMQYGVVPIISMLSGVQDTVTSIDGEEMDKGVGYMVYHDNCWMLFEAVLAAMEDFKDKENWKKLVRKNMITDFTWHNGSLKKYMRLYHSLNP